MFFNDTIMKPNNESRTVSTAITHCKDPSSPRLIKRFERLRNHFLGFFKNERQESETQIVSHPLSDFPGEVLVLVASFLLDSDAAIFSICNRTLWGKLGYLYWQKATSNKTVLPPFRDGFHRFIKPPYLTSQQKERLDFVCHIEKDLTHIIFCFYCQSFHKPSKTTQRCKPKVITQYHCPYNDDLCWSFRNRNLTFSYVKMLMKRHSLRFNVSSELSRLSNPWVGREGTTYFRARSRTARISENRLLLRTGHLIRLATVPLSGSLGIRCGWECSPETALWADRLFYFSSDELGAAGNLSDLVTCLFSHVEDEFNGCKTCSGVKRCSDASMEVELHARSTISGFVFGITIWQHFGFGISPYNSQWVDHFYRSPTSRHGRIWLPFERLDSIKNSFDSPIAIRACETTGLQLLGIAAKLWGDKTLYHPNHKQIEAPTFQEFFQWCMRFSAGGPWQKI